MIVRILFVGVYNAVRSHSLDQIVERLVAILKMLTFIDKSEGGGELQIIIIITNPKWSEITK